MILKRPVLWYLALFAIFTAIGVFFTFHFYLGDMPHSWLSFRHHFLDEMTGAWGAMVLVPFMVVLAQRFPFHKGAIAKPLLVNVAAMFVYTIAHTTIESALRYAFAPLLGVQESYTEIFSYTQEAAGDVVYYTLIMTSIYLLLRFAATRDIEMRLARAQLENLRLQLQPHFLFNTLNAISAVMYEDVGKADRMLAQVSDFMRLVLASGGVEEIPVDEELRMERMYVDIMKTRLERNLALNVNVADDAHSATVPFMLLQPLLENSIRHGMGSSRTSIELGIDVSRDNGSTVIRVSDNGLGFDASQPRGIGLSNIASRLSYLYGSRATFDVRPRDGGGTLAVVSLPC
ncbi:MAG TPA: histidine kinase [Candidatus Acidoferrum sp.]|nr:histidine kinase [Candidatus Acidoferrum sp.]